MRAPVALALFFKAFAIWLIVIGIIHLPSSVGSLISYWPTSEATEQPPAVVTGQDLKGLLVGNLASDGLRIAIGGCLLLAADRLATRLCRENAPEV